MFFSLLFVFQNVLYYSPCVLHNRWNENMAVKRDVQYIIKGYDLKTKSKKEHFSWKRCSSDSHKRLLPICFCLWLKATVSLDETTALSPQFNVFLLTIPSCYIVVAMQFLQTESCVWLSEWHKTKRPYIQLYRSTSMSENYITHICTGPRFTMHSSPMTELSISG